MLELKIIKLLKYIDYIFLEGVRLVFYLLVLIRVEIEVIYNLSWWLIGNDVFF